MFGKNRHLKKMYAYSYYFKSWLQVEHIGLFGWTFRLVTSEGAPVSAVITAQAKITEFTWYSAIRNHEDHVVQYSIEK